MAYSIEEARAFNRPSRKPFGITRLTLSVLLRSPLSGVHRLMAADSFFDVKSLFPADSSFDFQRWVAANSSFSARLPQSRCHWPKPMSRRLPPDRWYVLTLWYTARCCPDGLGCGCGCAPAAAATTRNSSPRGRIEAASPRTRITLAYGVPAVGNWRGAVRGTREHRKGEPAAQ
jgi:hypothetical protein